jgi:hypothetical protein
MPIIDAKTNLKSEGIPDGLQIRFNSHFAPIWGKDFDVSIMICKNLY